MRSAVRFGAAITVFVLVTIPIAANRLTIAAGLFVIAFTWGSLGVVELLDRRDERHAREEASRNGSRSEER